MSSNKLAEFLPQPEEKAKRVRTLISVSPKDYERITNMANQNNVSRGKVIEALLKIHDEWVVK